MGLDRILEGFEATSKQHRSGVAQQAPLSERDPEAFAKALAELDAKHKSQKAAELDAKRAAERALQDEHDAVARSRGEAAVEMQRRVHKRAHIDAGGDPTRFDSEVWPRIRDEIVAKRASERVRQAERDMRNFARSVI